MRECCGISTPGIRPGWKAVLILSILTLLPKPAAFGQDAGAIPGAGGGPAADAVAPANPNSDVRYSGTAIPGSRITIGFERDQEPGSSYQWKQVEGPRVAIDDPSRPSIRFVVPDDAEQLAFSVTIRGPSGDRDRRVTIPIRRGEPRALATGPIANAGDDQIGLVGRRITLDGSQSGSSIGRAISHRWIQVAGPKLPRSPASGPYFSFTPGAPGIYRFLLIVAADNVMSDPDEVEVIVGETPGEAGNAPRDPAIATSLAGLIDRAMLASGPIAGRSVGASSAEVLTSIADRIELYTDFGTLASEQMRRLDAIIPRDASVRAAWQQVFGLMSEQIVAELIPLGLDLRQPRAAEQPLGPIQKDRLKGLLQAYAREFRSRAQGR